MKTKREFPRITVNKKAELRKSVKLNSTQGIAGIERFSCPVEPVCGQMNRTIF